MRQDTRTLSIVQVLVDLVALAAVGAIALHPFGEIYGDHQWWWAAGLGLGVGAGVTLLARALRWGPLFTVLAAVVGYLLVGPAAAAPDQATAGVVPTLPAERVLVTGIVESWRSVLTLPVPLDSDRGTLVVPFVVALLAALLACTFLWRSRMPGLAWLPVAAAFGTAAAFGIRESELPLERGLVLAVVVLLWLRWRAVRTSPTAWLRRVVLAAVVLALAGGSAWALTSQGRPESRQVLRDHVVPPLAELDLKSPLARFRNYYKEHEKDVLFTFEGLPAGDPQVRLASMDAYDGLVWNVSTTDTRTGSAAFGPAPFTGLSSTIDVTVGEATGPWIPSVGTATGASVVTDAADDRRRELLLNRTAGAVVMHGDVAQGDEYRVEWSPRRPATPDLAEIPVDRSVPLAPMTFGSIEELDKLTQRWVSASGATNDFARIQAIQQKFRDEGFFNDGLTPEQRGYSASGHSARRLADLVSDPKRMVGNDEQYAAAMAYSVQKMGIPARVVLGFESVGSDGTVTGDDIAAWVEVPFEGRGWMYFDVTPNEDRIPPPLKDNPNPEPQPYVVQPPVLPQEPAELQGTPPNPGPVEATEESWDTLRAILAWVWTGVKVLLLLSPLWLVVLAKWWRRRRRARAGDPLARLTGGWREITDRARDLGTRLPVAETRREAGVLLAGRFPQAGSQSLAATADRHVFGPGTPTPTEVQQYWVEVDTACKAMRKATPWWRRVLAALSPVSLPWRAWGRRLTFWKSRGPQGRLRSRKGSS